MEDIQPTIQKVPRFFPPRGYIARGKKLTAQLQLILRIRMGVVIVLFLVYACQPRSGSTLHCLYLLATAISEPRPKLYLTGRKFTALFAQPWLNQT